MTTTQIWKVFFLRIPFNSPSLAYDTLPFVVNRIASNIGFIHVMAAAQKA